MDILKDHPAGQLPDEAEKAAQQIAQAYVDGVRQFAERGVHPDYLRTATPTELDSSALSAAMQGVLMSKQGDGLNLDQLAFSVGTALASTWDQRREIDSEDFLSGVVRGFITAMRHYATVGVEIVGKPQ